MPFATISARIMHKKNGQTRYNFYYLTMNKFENPEAFDDIDAAESARKVFEGALDKKKDSINYRFNNPAGEFMMRGFSGIGLPSKSSYFINDTFPEVI